MCLFASPYSKSLTMLFSPSLLRQMEIISFFHSPLSLLSPSLLSLRSVMSKPQAVFVLPFHSSPPLFAPQSLSLSISRYIDLYLKVFKLQQDLTSLTSASSLLSEVVIGVMTHTSLDRRNWWEAIRLHWSWSEQGGLHRCIPLVLDIEAWTVADL